MELDDFFLAAIREAEQEKLKILAMGALPDYSAYREQCGILAGLREARDLFMKAKRKVELSDEAFGDA